MPVTCLLSDDRAGVAEAARILGSGGLVAFPTETVYGLGADARDDRAVAGIFAAKDRPTFNPLIVHVPSLTVADRYADISGTMRDLAAAFWPGPLSLVAPVRAGTLSDLVTAGLPTVAIRVPEHPLAQRLLAAFDGPIAAPSANPSGKISPTSAGHVMEGLGGRIDAVVDGGACGVGLESTILGPGDGGVSLLRPGGLAPETIEAFLGGVLHRSDGGTITAPGQLESHYAPGAPLRLNADKPRPGEVWLGFGGGDVGPEDSLTLSALGDLTEAAANLFGHLRRLDHMAVGRPIAVAPIPDHGLGLAINDRLRRAAAPRP